MAQITYRGLDPNNDVIWSSTLTDVDAVAQAIRTRINLFQGEWWADLQDGTPVWQSMLGASGSLRNQQAISLLLQQRILGTPFVNSVSNVQASFNSSTRAFSFYAVVQTQFGTVSVSKNMPTPPSRGLPNGI
jgi:hypothetical protein